MWGLYSTCKTFALEPSAQLKVHDEWAAYQINSAVAWFGLYIENKLMEFDDHTKEPVYTIEELLSDTDEIDELTYEDNMAAVDQLASIRGAVRIKKR